MTVIDNRVTESDRKNTVESLWMEKMTKNTTNSADSGSKIASFKAKQNMPYDFKVNYAKIRAREFYNECGKRDLDC